MKYNRHNNNNYLSMHASLYVQWLGANICVCVCVCVCVLYACEGAVCMCMHTTLYMHVLVSILCMLQKVIKLLLKRACCIGCKLNEEIILIRFSKISEQLPYIDTVHT